MVHVRAWVSTCVCCEWGGVGQSSLPAGWSTGDNEVHLNQHAIMCRQKSGWMLVCVACAVYLAGVSKMSTRQLSLACFTLLPPCHWLSRTRRNSLLQLPDVLVLSVPLVERTWWLAGRSTACLPGHWLLCRHNPPTLTHKHTQQPKLTMPPDEHCIGLWVVLYGLTQPVCQLTLTRCVLNDGHHAVAVEAMTLNALQGHGEEHTHTHTQAAAVQGPGSGWKGRAAAERHEAFRRARLGYMSEGVGYGWCVCHTVSRPCSPMPLLLGRALQYHTQLPGTTLSKVLGMPQHLSCREPKPLL